MRITIDWAAIAALATLGTALGAGFIYFATLFVGREIHRAVNGKFKEMEERIERLELFRAVVEGKAN